MKLGKLIVWMGVFFVMTLEVFAQPTATPFPIHLLDMNQDGTIDARDILLFVQGWEVRGLVTPTPTPRAAAIRGFVASAADQSPVAGAFIFAGTRTAQSNEGGFYELLDVSSNTTFLIAGKQGFRVQNLPIQLTYPQTVINIQLEPVDFPTRTLTITQTQQPTASPTGTVLTQTPTSTFTNTPPVQLTATPTLTATLSGASPTATVTMVPTITQTPTPTRTLGANPLEGNWTGTMTGTILNNTEFTWTVIDNSSAELDLIVNFTGTYSLTPFINRVSYDGTANTIAGTATIHMEMFWNGQDKMFGGVYQLSIPFVGNDNGTISEMTWNP